MESYIEPRYLKPIKEAVAQVGAGIEALSAPPHQVLFWPPFSAPWQIFGELLKNLMTSQDTVCKPQWSGRSSGQSPSR